MISLTDTYLGNTILQYLLFLGILAGAVLAGKLVTWISKNFLKVFASKTKTNVDDVILGVLEAPVLFTIFIAALWYGQRALTLSEGVQTFLDKALWILLVINAAWYLIRFLNSAIEHYIKPMTAKTKTDLDDHMLPIIQRLVRIVIVIIVAIMVIDRLGYDVTSLIAGLGLGGLAFALAAQDLVSNLFGGIAILTDKPFRIGDRIKIGDVDGFVKEIGLRTTRVKTFGGTIIVLPNSQVVDSVLENISQEKMRRMTMTIGVEYGTSLAKIEKAKKIITQQIKKVKGLDHEEMAVAFNKFDDSSLNIFVVYWITKEGMNEYFGVQDKLLTGIKREFEKAKIEMAFPTQTIHVKK